MDSIVTDRIQKELRSRKLSEIVRETGRNFGARASVDLRNIFDVYEECNPEVNPEFKKALSADTLKLAPSDTDGTASSPSDGGAMRSAIVNAMVSASNEQLAPEYGIEIVDMHFKYLNYSHQVHEQIIKQIEADRKDDISSYLEVGQKCVGYINRIADAERGTILGEGERRVRELDGEAVARAIQIKAEAFQKDPEFFQFLKDLEIVGNVMNDRSKLVLSTQNPLLGLLQRGPGLPPGAEKRVKASSAEEPKAAQKAVRPAPKPTSEEAAKAVSPKVEAKPAEAKPAEAKPAEAKPAEAKPAGAPAKR
jgi:HflC protein